MKTIIIAEAGVNHNGKLHIAKKMVDHAKRAGADYIKFQSFDSNEIVTESAKKAEYQLEKNDIVLFAAFGGGFTWGSMLIKWS